MTPVTRQGGACVSHVPCTHPFTLPPGTTETPLPQDHETERRGKATPRPAGTGLSRRKRYFRKSKEEALAVALFLRARAVQTSSAIDGPSHRCCTSTCRSLAPPTPSPRRRSCRRHRAEQVHIIRAPAKKGRRRRRGRSGAPPLIRTSRWKTIRRLRRRRPPPPSWFRHRRSSGTVGRKCSGIARW